MSDNDIVVVYMYGTIIMYRPMNTLTLTQNVKNLLNTKRNEEICQARDVTLFVKEGEKPDSNGDYTKNQIDRIVITSGGVFIKKRIVGEDIKFFDINTGEEVPIP